MTKEIDQKAWLKPILGMIFLGLCVFLIMWMNRSGFLTFETLVKNKDALKAFVMDHYIRAVIIFIIAYFLATTFSLPTGLIMSLAGGFLFGALPGTIYINIGATAGATALFIGSRYFFGNYFQGKYGANIQSLNNDLEKNGKSYLLTLRLIPIFPFFLVNLMAGLSTISLMTFVWTTALGIIPGSFVYAYAGNQLSSIQTTEDIVSPSILLALVMLGILALVPTVYGKVQQRKGES